MNINNDKNIWLIKSSGGEHINDFLENNNVFIGFSFNDSLEKYSTREEIRESNKFIGTPGYNAVGQLFRFSKEIKEGDYIVTYNPSTREYYYGNSGKYSFEADDERPKHLRIVKWENTDSGIKRDNLPQNIQNAFGSLLTVTRLRDDLVESMKNIIEGVVISENFSQEYSEEIVDEFFDFESNSREDIKTKILSISSENMENFIAGIFRGMGYQTKKNGTHTQADGGYDILASKDGLGIGDETILIEVKHRRNQMGSDDIRGFETVIQGRKGVYVSLGGFSRDAYNMTHRTGNLALLDIEGLVDLIFEYYDNFDAETRNFLPLKKIYILDK